MKPRRILYSAAELAFVEARRAMSRAEIRDAFVAEFNRPGVTVDHIKALCTRNGWTTDRERWSAEDDALLRALYPDTPSVDVARRVGRPLTATYARAQILGLHKSAAYFESYDAGRMRPGDQRGAGSRFAKGSVPANKGKPMPFHPNSAATRFKKGQATHNAKWVGHERVTKDGYVEIKLDGVNPYTGYQRRHMLKHKWLWEQEHGPVPRGMALKSKNGNRQDTDPSNWELVPRALLPRLNGRDYDGAPDQLKPLIMAAAKLTHAVAERRRA